MLELKGHSKSVYGVSQYKECDDDFANNTRLILSASADETVRLWDSHVGNCVAKYFSHGGAVWSVSFAQYGYYFAACNQNSTASVFATDRVIPLRILSGHKADVTCSSWHPNLVSIATGSDDCSVRLWDMRTGNAVRIFSGCSASITSVAISPRGDSIAAGCGSGSNNICWDIGTGRLLVALNCKDTTHSVAYDNSGSIIVTGGSAGAICVWNISDGVGHGTTVKSADWGAGDPLLEPMHRFHTKRCPVYSVGVGLGGVIIGAGPVLSDNCY